MTRLRLVVEPAARWPDRWRVMFVLLVLMIGFRHEVGGDWFTYAEHIEAAGYETVLEAMGQGDPAYSLLNWLAARGGLGPYFVNTVCAVIFSWGLVVFCRAQPLPWLALVVSIPYLVTVVAMGYTRQGTAIGLAMLALVDLSKHKLVRFVVFVALAATFHKSAVILMPLAVLSGTRNKFWTALWVGMSTLIFYWLLLQNSVESLQTNYIAAEYQSQGTGLRLAMNAVPAVIFLLFRRRFVMPAAESIFWTWMSLGALVFIGLLIISPSSTAVDRVALYWIPLQLFVLSRMPTALGKQHGTNQALVHAVVVYSGSVLFVWLVFANTAFAWLPYQFYPWILLWK
jgi:hypothetical protein